MLDVSGQWILSRTQSSTEFATITALAKAGIEAWTPQRITRRRVSRHVRRFQEIRAATLSPYIFIRWHEASTARIALGEYFKAHGVYKLNGDLTIVRAAVIADQWRRSASSTIRRSRSASRSGKAKPCSCAPAASSRRKVMRDTPLDARVPVEFDSACSSAFRRIR